jgi:hypothetical protein
VPQEEAGADGAEQGGFADLVSGSKNVDAVAEAINMCGRREASYPFYLMIQAADFGLVVAKS